MRVIAAAESSVESDDGRALRPPSLQLSSSQKQSLPLRLLWDMQTWSTIKRLMLSSLVQVLVTKREAAGERESERKKRKSVR